LHPENHGVVEVRYVVAGTPYQGTFFPYLKDRPIAKGESVHLYYWPHDPSIAFMVPPEEALAEELPSWIAGSLLGSLGITAGVRFLWGMLARILKANPRQR
jgi:hypothetical protein